MNTKAKGSRNERKVRDILRGEGWLVIKAGASLGLWDLVALHPDRPKPCLVQVKSNRKPPTKELAALNKFACHHPFTECYYVVVKDRQTPLWTPVPTSLERVDD